MDQTGIQIIFRKKFKKKILSKNFKKKILNKNFKKKKFKQKFQKKNFFLTNVDLYTKICRIKF